MPRNSVSGHRRSAPAWSAGIAGLCMLAAAVAAPGAGARPDRSDPHGQPSTSGFIDQITWTKSSPAGGLTLLTGTYRNPDAHPYWTDVIQAPATSPFTGESELAEAGSAAWAAQTEATLTAQGFAPTADVLPWPDYIAVPQGAMATRVRVGNFATQAAAKAAAAALTAAGFAPLTEWTGFDPDAAPDSELLHVAIVDPRRFAGQVVADHGSAVGGTQTASAASAALGSLATTNAGFFTIHTHFAQVLPVEGVNTGISVYHGRLESLADGDRAAFVVGDGRPARIEHLTTTATLSAGSRSIQILGLNRLPGTAEDCGVTGMAPTSSPRQNTFCTGPNDLVLFTPEFGAPLPAVAPPATAASAVQVVLDAHDRVLSLGAVGTAAALPAGESAIQAIGTQAMWITQNVHVGDRVAIDEQIRTSEGDRLRLTPTTSIVSAGPMLLHDGRTAIEAVREGEFDTRDLNDYTFSAYRHPRTIVGVDSCGRIILATADGVPGASEGLSLTEEAELMRSLGAVDAMNLDGGGSTQFAADGQLVDLVNDSSGNLRPVGGTLNVIPTPAHH